ncbi:transglutaminase-like domain-containing protein [Porcipelethomonas sp.]|uniref:transglutaminase-like domain-containing protein n=1 Tax=Porcipelethomonas sp. TaxID=2981675 RepID=UPI003EF61024
MEQNNSYNGIRIIDSMHLSVPKTRKIINIIPLIIIAFLGIWGTVSSYLSMFNIHQTASVRLCIIVIFAILTIIFMLPKKIQIILIPAIIAYTVLLYRKWNQFILGFKIIFNMTYSEIYPEKRDYFRLKETNIDDAQLFLYFSIFILTFLICYFTFIHPNFFMGFLCTFPFIEIGLYYGKCPDIIPSFMMIIFWTSLLVIQFSGYNNESDKKASGFFRKYNNFIAKPGIKFRISGLSSLYIIVICCIIFSISAAAIKISGYNRSEKTNQIRTNMKTAASEFTFEDLGESLERFSESFGIGNYKMYNHKLGNLNSVTFNRTTDLTVFADSVLEENIYLKGYVGAQYSNNSWADFPDELYNKYDSMFSEFYESKSFPQDMLTDYMMNNYITDLSNIKIKSKFKNEKYNYTPYSSVPDGEITYINDTIIKLDSFSEYSFKIGSKQIGSDNLEDFLNNYHNEDTNKTYTDFVHENYCKVPDTDDMDNLYEKFIKNSNIPYEDTYSKLDSIKNILSENAEYTLRPGKTPDSEDFVSYFLNENHKGYCVHFATSGIILARMAGIPARYAEGYVMLKDDFSDENQQEDGSYKIEIKDERAHAWAEIYIDGLGWIPYEFTPSAAAALNPEYNNSTNNNTAKITLPTLPHISGSQASPQSPKSNTGSSEHKTSVISTDAQTLISSGNNKTSTGKDKSEFRTEIMLTALAVLVAALITGYIIVNHIYKTKKRINSFKNGSNKEKAIYAYNYIILLLSFIKIENNNMQYLEFAEYAEKNTENIFHDNEFVNATYTALKAKLSAENPENSETEKIINLGLKTAETIYQQLNIFKKFYMKYIKNLK